MLPSHYRSNRSVVTLIAPLRRPRLRTSNAIGAAACLLWVHQVSGDFTENFDAATPPTPPSGWVATNESGPAPPWVITTTGSDSGPNSAFVDDPDGTSDKRLDSPSIPIATNTAVLTFRHSFSLHSFYDGGVLEISIDGGSFVDILAAGGSFAAGGYNYTIQSGPLNGRGAWSGDSGGYRTVTVNLPVAAAGKNIVLRFRMGSNDFGGLTGWQIDSIVIQSQDRDADIVADGVDNCPDIVNSDQVDADSDGLGDACDTCPTDPSNSATDTDGDGTLDCNDECPSETAKTVAGACGCGVPDADSNGDGVADCLEVSAPAEQLQAVTPAGGCGTCGAGMPLMMGIASFSLLCARSPRRLNRILCVLLMGMFLCAGPSIVFAGGRDDVPEGLSSSDWSGIRAAYETGRHAADAVDDGYLVRNLGQRWRTRFDGCGFLTTPDSGQWSWGLELVSYGRDGAERAVQSVKRATIQHGPRVEYEWDENLTEWYVNDTRGLEHGYTVHQFPNDRIGGTPFLPLNFTLAVCGDLRPVVSADGRDVTFVSASGAAVVNYNGLTVIDADEATLRAWFEAAGDELRLFVDDRGARYPLTIDPIAQQAYLKASNTSAGDFFGDSVAISGDTVIVGAHSEDSSATGVNGDQADDSAATSGAAYVFVRDSHGSWSQQAYLKASNTGAGDFFGLSVAVSGDTAVIGAVLEDSSATGIDGNQADNSAADSGAAYVFVRNGTTWSQQAYLKASNTEAGDQFGISVATSGDTVLVGASFERSSATGVNGNEADNGVLVAGAAYVFVRNGETWTQQAYLKASNTEMADMFGCSVALDGETAVVGALGEDSSATGINGNEADNNATNAGAAYVFVRNGTAWTQQAYLKASNTDADDFFGGSVAASGDTAVVGASNEESSATGVNGDQADNSTRNAGAAYVFFRDTAGVWSQQAYLKASNTGASDQFGKSVATSGDTVVVGAFLEDSNSTGIDGNQADNSAADSGAAYVFVRDAASTWSHQSYLKASNTDSTDRFGSSVAASGDTIIVGANCESGGATGVNGNQADDSASNSGAVYVFTPDTDGDGVADTLDGCVTDPAKAAPGQCGCFNPDTDSDGDGTADCIDGCIGDAGKTAAGTCGCGTPDSDSDGDGTADCIDQCPTDPNKSVGGVCGCGVSDTDSDGDGLGDGCDNCPAVSNADQSDTDDDGIGDACEAALINASAAPPAGQGETACGTCGAGTTMMMPFIALGVIGLKRRHRA